MGDFYYHDSGTDDDAPDTVGQEAVGHGIGSKGSCSCYRCMRSAGPSREDSDSRIDAIAEILGRRDASDKPQATDDEDTSEELIYCDADDLWAMLEANNLT